MYRFELSNSIRRDSYRFYCNGFNLLNLGSEFFKGSNLIHAYLRANSILKTGSYFWANIHSLAVKVGCQKIKMISSHRKSISFPFLVVRHPVSLCQFPRLLTVWFSLISIYFKLANIKYVLNSPVMNTCTAKGLALLGKHFVIQSHFYITGVFDSLLFILIESIAEH